MKVKKSALHLFCGNKQFRKGYPRSGGRLLSRYCGLFIFTLYMLTLFLCARTSAQEKSRVVRLAKLQIDTAHLDSYKEALKLEIETSVRVEPGVLTLYAVYEKDNPTHITIFEIYANESAYRAHLETPHFKKYKTTTKEMVKSLDLVETVPLVLGSKPK